MSNPEQVSKPMSAELVEYMRSVWKRSLAYYGRPRQVLKAIEEFNEAAAELAKYLGLLTEGKQVPRSLLDKCREEMADAIIMADQARTILGEEDVDAWVRHKLLRHEGKMNAEGVPTCE